jgi:hypothetical protein
MAKLTRQQQILKSRAKVKAKGPTKAGDKAFKAAVVKASRKGTKSTKKFRNNAQQKVVSRSTRTYSKTTGHQGGSEA